MYEIPYKVSDRAMECMVEIAAALERYKIAMEGPDGVRLRKLNHIRTIRGTTAIEGNTLTEEQITAVLAGKHVVAPKREITEVINAHKAYSAIESFNPYSADDLLKAHSLMTDGLVDRPGKWRNCNVGVMGSEGVSHIAPPFNMVPDLMSDLFAWLNESEAPVLIKSSVFHYEFEFIHPFPDGNGRMGRLWQTAILGNWREEFYGVPVENIVWAHQSEYYEAIRMSGAVGECGPFIDFILDKILRTLKAKGEAYEIGRKGVVKSRDKSRVKSRDKSRDKILRLLKSQPQLTQADLADAMGLSIKAVEKAISQLKDANRLRRKGGKKFGEWEVV